MPHFRVFSKSGGRGSSRLSHCQMGDRAVCLRESGPLACLPGGREPSPGGRGQDWALLGPLAVPATGPVSGSTGGPFLKGQVVASRVSYSWAREVRKNRRTASENHRPHCSCGMHCYVCSLRACPFNDTQKFPIPFAFCFQTSLSTSWVSSR